MTAFIAWCGFAGAWLLFAGPVYQASLELAEESFDRGELVRAARGVAPAAHVSNWWWLIPPVGWLRTQRAQRDNQEAVLAALGADRVESLVGYMNKSAGWLLVGLGGLLIAVKETWELHEYYEWPLWAFWALTVAAALSCGGYTVSRRRRSTDIRRKFVTQETAPVDPSA